MTHKPLKAMTISAKETHRAILKLISALAGPTYQSSDRDKPLDLQIELCMDCLKAEAWEAVALIDACAPHGRSMLSQAQQK